MTVEERRAYRRNRYWKNPDRFKEEMKSSHQRNRAKRNAHKIETRKATKEIRNAQKRALYKANPEKYGAQCKAWRMANREKLKAARVLKDYGITLQDVAKMLEAQGGCCAICRRPGSDFASGLHIDHDHSTHLIRGLLCWPCNVLLPSRRDLVSLLQRAIGYLGSPPAIRSIGERYTPGRRKKIVATELELPF